MPEGIITLALKNCDNTTDSGHFSSKKLESNNFRHIDFTDLGDMEDDPVVQRIEMVMGNHQHNSH